MDPYLEYKNKARTQFSQFMRQEINQKRVNHNKELMGPPQIPIVKIIEQLADIKNVTEQDSMNLKTQMLSSTAIALDPSLDQSTHSVEKRLFPHEFLYLCCNAQPRNDMLLSMKPPKMDIKMEPVGEYDAKQDGRRLDRIYRLDTANQAKRYNPREQLRHQLSLECKDKRIKINGMRNLMNAKDELKRKTENIMRNQEREEQRKIQFE